MPATRKPCFAPDEECDLYGYPETVQRKNTDMGCTLIFAVCLAGMCALMYFASRHSELNRFVGLPDYNGKFCGVSGSVQDKPYLYFCRTSDWPGMQRKNRLCVERCDVIPTVCPSGSAAHEYQAEAYADLLCLPTRLGLTHLLFAQFLHDPDVFLFLTGVALTRAWPAIFISVMVSVVLGFLFLCTAGCCRRWGVFVLSFLVSVAAVSLGIYLILLVRWGGADHVESTGDEMASIVAGGVVILTGLILLLVTALNRNNMQASLAALRSATECILDTPSIVFEPFLALTWRLTLLLAAAMGWLTLLSWLDFRETHFNDEVSVKVKMDYSWYKYCSMGFYLFMLLWVLELGTAISYFAVSYASQQWFFAPYDTLLKSKDAPKYGACAGYKTALVYHFGTMVYGSFCLTVFRVPRMIIGTVTYVFPGCCSRLWSGFLMYMSSYAYMDTTLNANRWCKAAYHSSLVMDHSSVKFFTQHGASWLVQAIGLCTVAGSSAVVTYILCRRPGFMVHLANEEPLRGLVEDSYIPVPSLMAFLSAFVCAYAAMPFVMLHGHVSDNILFCFAIERYRLSQNVLNKAATETMGMFSALAACTSREQEHVAGSTRAHPRMTQILLEEAKHDYDGVMDGH